MGKADAIGYALKNVIVPGLEERRRRKEEFQARLEAALVQSALTGQQQEQVYEMRDGKLNQVGAVPKGSTILRDPNSGNPLDQLRNSFMQNTAAMNGPGILEQQMNQMGPEQLGSMQVQQQYGQSVLGQQAAQQQLPILAQQAQALQGAGLMGQKGQGGASDILQPPQDTQSSIGMNLRERAIQELRMLGQPITEENIQEVMRQLSRGS